MEPQKEMPGYHSTIWNNGSIKDRVQEICSTTGIVGMSAAVIYEDQVVWDECIGYCNLEKKERVARQTLFPIGALSQIFTAAVVAQLSHKNILHYDDKVSQHLKDFRDPNAAVPDNTTIADLLGHRTGLQAAESVLTGYGGRVCLLQDEIIAAYHNLKRLAEPRSRFIHGAINYTLLEEVINECCSEGYWEYLKRNVWVPLGMFDANDEYPEIRERYGDAAISELYYVGRRGQKLPLECVDCLDSDLAPDSPSLKLDKPFPTNDLESLRSYCKDKAFSTDDFKSPPSYRLDKALSTDDLESLPSYRLDKASSTDDLESPPSYCKDKASFTNKLKSLRFYRLDKAFLTNSLESLRSYCRQQCQNRLYRLLPNDPLIAEKDNSGSRHLSTYRKQQAMAEEIICLQKVTMQNTTRGMVSSLRDLISFCIGLNRAADKSLDCYTRGWKHAFPDVDLLFSPLQAMQGDSNNEEIKNTRSYAAGWATTTLPGRLQGLGINSKLVSMPFIELGQIKASKVYWNQGVHSGSNCFVALLPETKSAVIVLTNTTTANDAADWIGQLLLQSLLGGCFNKHIPLVKMSVNEAHKQHDALDNNFNFDKGSNFWGSSSRPLEQYMGMYASSSDKRITLIVWPETYKGVRPFQDKKPVFGKEVRTRMTVQFANRMKRFVLRHLYNDSFSWYSDWEGLVAGGKPTNYPPEHYILHFHPCKFDNRRIGSVTWLHDPELPEGEETFVRIQ